MAAILESLLLKQVSPAEIVRWLATKYDKEESIPCALLTLSTIRSEFITYFLNFLRDQTSHLQHTRSANTTPAKNPLCTKSSTSRKHERAGVQLFKSPAEANKTDNHDINVIRSLDSGRARRTTQRLSCSPTTQQQETRSKHRHNLAEFFTESSRRSPQGEQSFGSPSPQNSRRAKSRCDEMKKQAKVKSDSSMSVLCLTDKDAFPALGNLDTLPERVPSIPTGAKVITKSRRVATTTLTPNKKLEVNTVFQSAPITPEQRSWSAFRNDSSGRSADRAKLGNLQQRLFATKLDEKNVNENEKKTRRRSAAVSLGQKSINTQPEVSSVDCTTMPNYIDARRSETTHTQNLRLMAELYASCIQENLVPNVTVELYFVVQLLTAQQTDTSPKAFRNEDVEDIHYFSSVHNMVYFAVTSLLYLQRLLVLLDRATLRLIVDHTRVADFLPELKDNLRLHIEQPSTTKVAPLSQPSPICRVSFQADTDNRNNFPCDSTFHLFKKQRDMFYEVIREWTTKHLSACWNMRTEQEQRIRWLTSSQTPLVNHLHFVRLFCSQLISMCKGDESVRVFEDEDKNVALLARLKQTNPAKFKRLQERFVTPSSTGGPCPSPSFPGCQELFSDFILIASSAMFNQHLLNYIAAKVSELNKTQFLAPSEQEDMEVTKTDNRATLFDCLVTLRLLGKYLGFVAFLPYRSPERLPESLRTTYIIIRNQSAPPIDVLVYLEHSLVEGSTVLTVPWLVEFLSMMDQTAPKLTYFSSVIHRLLALHRTAGQRLLQKPSHSALLIVLMLGWLFELPVFPKGFFFRDLPELNLTNVPTYSLDEMDLIDHRILFACCPYLGEVRNVLVDSAVGEKSRTNNIRKITPVSTQSTVSVVATEMQLKSDLEANFFHNHPASLKRAVDFLADRIASNYIKKFRAQVIPGLLSAGCTAMERLATVRAAECIERKGKERVLCQVEEEATKVAIASRQQAQQEAHIYCTEKAPAILADLLPEEVAPLVLQVSARIAQHGAEQKVETWLTTHLTSDFFKLEFLAEFEKHLRNQQLRDCGKTPLNDRRPVPLVPPTYCNHHDETCIAPADMVIKFKEMLVCIMGQDELWDSPQICDILNQTMQLFASRKDIIPAVYQSLGRMSVDLAYTLVLRYPTTWTKAVEDCAVRLWTSYLREYTSFQNIICAKHMHCIASQSNVKHVWSTLTQFSITLLSNSLLKPQDLQLCLSKVLNNPSSEASLEQLGYFIRTVVSSFDDTQMTHVLSLLGLLNTVDTPVKYHTIETSMSDDTSMIHHSTGNDMSIKCHTAEMSTSADKSVTCDTTDMLASDDVSTILHRSDMSENCDTLNGDISQLGVTSFKDI